MKLSKKEFQLNLLTTLLAENTFFTFFSVNNFNVKGKIELKKQLNKLGFDFKVLKKGY